MHDGPSATKNQPPTGEDLGGSQGQDQGPGTNGSGPEDVPPKAPPGPSDGASGTAGRKGAPPLDDAEKAAHAGRIGAMPARIRGGKRLCLWRREWNAGKGKYDKVPYQLGKVSKARINDAGTWQTVEKAIAAFLADDNGAEPVHGIMRAFTKADKIAFGDLDRCLKPDGTLKQWAVDILTIAGPTTIEVSQSGEGLHVFIGGEIPEGTPQFIQYPDGGKFELFDTHFCALTGIPYGDAMLPMADDQAAVNALSAILRAGKDQKDRTEAGGGGSFGRSDAAVLQAALENPKFATLFLTGDLSDFDNDDSGADFFLLWTLASWAGQDAAQITRVARRSALNNREKWDREDYLPRTIAKVFAKMQPSDYHGKHEAPDLFPTTTATELKAKPPPKFLVKDVVIERSVNVMYGHPGTKKSFLALDMAYSIATGKPWQGFPTEQGNVLYIAAEGEYVQSARLRALEIHRGTVVTKELIHIPVPVNFLLPAERDRLKATIYAHGEPFSLIVVDTVAQSMMGGDENSPRDMQTFVGALQDLVLTFDVAVLGIHHTTKNGGGGPRGHGSLNGALSTTIQVESAGALVRVTCAKLRGAPEFPRFNVEMKLIPVERALTPTTPVLERTEREFKGEDDEKVTLEARCLWILNTLGKGGPVRNKEWQDECGRQLGISKSTFERYRNKLIDDHRVFEAEKAGNQRCFVSMHDRPQPGDDGWEYPA